MSLSLESIAVVELGDSSRPVPRNRSRDRIEAQAAARARARRARRAQRLQRANSGPRGVHRNVQQEYNSTVEALRAEQHRARRIEREFNDLISSAIPEGAFSASSTSRIEADRVTDRSRARSAGSD